MRTLQALIRHNANIPLQNNKGEYKVKVFGPDVLLLRPRNRIVLPSGQGIEPPDCDILAAHAAIAAILSVSGIGAQLDRFRQECELDNRDIKSDGSSDLFSMISRRLMII